MAYLKLDAMKTSRKTFGSQYNVHEKVIVALYVNDKEYRFCISLLSHEDSNKQTSFPAFWVLILWRFNKFHQMLLLPFTFISQQLQSRVQSAFFFRNLYLKNSTLFHLFLWFLSFKFLETKWRKGHLLRSKRKKET